MDCFAICLNKPILVGFRLTFDWYEYWSSYCRRKKSHHVRNHDLKFYRNNQARTSDPNGQSNQICKRRLKMYFHRPKSEKKEQSPIGECPDHSFTPGNSYGHLRIFMQIISIEIGYRQHLFKLIRFECIHHGIIYIVNLWAAKYNIQNLYFAFLLFFTTNVCV